MITPNFSAFEKERSGCNLKSWGRKSFGRKYKTKWIYFTNGKGEVIYNRFKNNNDQCSKDVFECDRRLASDLLRYSSDWQEKFQFSNFDYRREWRCKNFVPLEISAEELMERGRKNKKKKKFNRISANFANEKRVCCGGGDNQPFQLMPKDSCDRL